MQSLTATKAMCHMLRPSQTCIPYRLVKLPRGSIRTGLVENAPFNLLLLELVFPSTFNLHCSHGSAETMKPMDICAVWIKPEW